METDEMACKVLAITIEGLDEFDLEEESESFRNKKEMDKEKGEKVHSDEMGQNENSEETDSNRETELLDDFRFKLLEDRGEIMEESTLLRDLKDLKEKSLERKRARRLKKLKVKFQDKAQQLSPFQRSCCKCPNNKGKCIEDDGSNANVDDSTVMEQVSCNGSPKCRQLMKMSSIDLYGCIIPKDQIKDMI